MHLNMTHPRLISSVLVRTTIGMRVSGMGLGMFIHHGNYLGSRREVLTWDGHSPTSEDVFFGSKGAVMRLADTEIRLIVEAGMKM